MVYVHKIIVGFLYKSVPHSGTPHFFPVHYYLFLSKNRPIDFRKA